MSADEKTLLTTENFLKNFPEFSKAVKGREVAHKSMSDAILCAIPVYNFFLQVTNKEEQLDYYKGLAIAHFTALVFADGSSGGIPLGDEASTSVSKGGVSFSTSRISYSEYLADPSWSRTKYGQTLATLQRQHNISITSTGNSDLVQSGNLSSEIDNFYLT